MRKRRLGKNGPEVFPVGLGGMPLSIAGRPSEEEAIRTIHAALDAGMDLIDTADVYCLDDADMGHNERLIAKALRQWKGGRQVLVATKGGLRRPAGAWTRDARPERMKEACEASLRALGVETLDLYQLHAPDEKVRFEDTVGALAELKKAGKVRLVGLSNVSVAQIRTAVGIVPVATVQNRFNPFFREAEQSGVLKACEELGLGFLPYSPVGGGRLNKKLPTHAVVRAVAQRLGTTPHAAVLAWVMAKSPACIPIPGASRPGSAVASVAAASVNLSLSDIAEIDRASFPTD